MHVLHIIRELLEKNNRFFQAFPLPQRFRIYDLGRQK